MADEVETLSPDKLVAVYIKIRDKIKEHEEEIDRYKEQMQAVSNKMLEFCAESNADSVRTPSGTISRSISSRYWTNDWDAMYKFIQEHDALFLLEKRISNGSLKEFMAENPNLHPPGLQAKSEYVIKVTKPRAH